MRDVIGLYDKRESAQAGSLAAYQYVWGGNQEETPELFKETAEWVKDEMEQIERNERAARKVLESIQPLLDKKRDNLINVQGQTKIF